MVNLVKLINKHEWNKIYNMLRDDKIDLKTPIANGNILVHYASINDASKVLEYIVEKYPDTLTIIDNDGNSSLHLMAKYRYTDILKKCISKMIMNDIDILYLMNDNGETIYNILYDDYSFIKWLSMKHNKINFNIPDNDGITILLKNIYEHDKENDEHYKIVKLLLDYGVNVNHPVNLPPLNYAIKNKKDDLVSLLLNKKADVNKRDYNSITSLLYAINNNNIGCVKLLLKHGADVNYIGPEGDLNPLIYSIQNKNNDMINILLDYKFDVKKYDKQMNTPLHHAIKSNNSIDVLFRMIHLSDINAQNIDGDTPLHLLADLGAWKNLNVILEKKKLDIFMKNRKNKTVLDYVSPNDIQSFLHIVTNSYFNNINDSQLNKIYKNHNNCLQSNSYDNIKCIEVLKDYILDNKKSIPDDNDKEILIKELNIHDKKNKNDVTTGKFNSDVLHNMIYTICLLKKYDNVGIPYQNMINDKYINDKMNLSNNNLYKEDTDLIIPNIIGVYMDYFYEMIPYLILWKNKYVNHVHKDLSFHIKKCFDSKKIEYIMLKLSIIITSNSTHANIIIIDKKRLTVERFEPYGIVPQFNSDDLDDFIKSNLLPVCLKYYKKDFTYLTPSELNNNVGFQAISNDGSSMVKKMGDPLGYCLAWTLWYLELRVENKNISSDELIKKSLSDIINKNKREKDNNRIMIDFIRDYTIKLDRMKNDFMKESGIKRKDIYNISLSDEDKDKIVKQLTHALNDMNDRYDV